MNARAVLLACSCGAALAACQTYAPRSALRYRDLGNAHATPQDAAVAAPEQSTVRGGIYLLGGVRRTSDALGLAGIHQGSYALQGELAPAAWPLGIEIGYARAAGSDNGKAQLFGLSYDSFHSKTTEVTIGPRLTSADEAGGVYLGAGVVSTRIRAEEGRIGSFGANKQSDSGSDTGFYAKAGAFGHLGLGSIIMIEVQFTFDQRISLFSDYDDVDYWQISLGIGQRF